MNQEDDYGDETFRTFRVPRQTEDNIPVTSRRTRTTKVANEGTLTRELVARLRRMSGDGVVVLRHVEMVTAGVPDISLTSQGITLWVEIKCARPRVFGRGPQLLMMQRLDRHGYAVYVVYEESTRRVHCIQPHNIGNWPESIVLWTTEPARGHKFNQDVVAEKLLKYPRLVASF